MKKTLNPDLNRPTVDDYKQLEKLPLIIVLDNIRSTFNVGSVFRTSDAFLVEAIYLCGITAIPPNKDINKSALGATESVAWKHFESITEALVELKNKGYYIYAIEQTDKSVMLKDFVLAPKAKAAIILGNEVNGVSDEAIEYVDTAIEIPQYGTKHSLNVSVTAGIVIWDFFNRYQK